MNLYCTFRLRQPTLATVPHDSPSFTPFSSLNFVVKNSLKYSGRNVTVEFNDKHLTNIFSDTYLRLYRLNKSLCTMCQKLIQIEESEIYIKCNLQKQTY